MRLDKRLHSASHTVGTIDAIGPYCIVNIITVTPVCLTGTLPNSWQYCGIFVSPKEILSGIFLYILGLTCVTAQQDFRAHHHPELHRVGSGEKWRVSGRAGTGPTALNAQFVAFPGCCSTTIVLPKEAGGMGRPWSH